MATSDSVGLRLLRVDRHGFREDMIGRLVTRGPGQSVYRVVSVSYSEPRSCFMLHTRDIMNDDLGPTFAAGAVFTMD